MFADAFWGAFGGAFLGFAIITVANTLYNWRNDDDDDG